MRSRAPRRQVVEWVAGVLALPVQVQQPRPFTPEIMVLMEAPSGYLLSQTLLDPAVPKGPQQATLLRSTLAKSDAIAPTRLRVNDSTLAEVLRSASPKLDVVVAPTPELAQVAASLAQHFSGHEYTVPFNSYLASGVSPRTLGELFAAAGDLFDMAPWQIALDCDTIRIDMPSRGFVGMCASILGAAEEVYGVLLFKSQRDFDDFGKLATQRRKKKTPIEILSLTFAEEARLPPALRREIKLGKWRVAGRGVYPVIECMSTSGESRPLSESECAFFADALGCLLVFIAENQTVFVDELFLPASMTFESHGGAQVIVTAPYDAFEEIEAATNSPGEALPAKIRQLKFDHYAAWLDEKVPALGGKTPREAARTKAGRKRVTALLDQFVTEEARLPPAERFDFTALRQALGLA